MSNKQIVLILAGFWLLFAGAFWAAALTYAQLRFPGDSAALVSLAEFFVVVAALTLSIAALVSWYMIRRAKRSRYEK